MTLKRPPIDRDCTRITANSPGQLSLKFSRFPGVFNRSRALTNKQLVPRRGLEPPRPCERQHLKLVRLPIPPSGHGVGRADAVLRAPCQCRRVVLVNYFRSKSVVHAISCRKGPVRPILSGCMCKPPPMRKATGTRAISLTNQRLRGLRALFCPLFPARNDRHRESQAVVDILLSAGAAMP